MSAARDNINRSLGKARRLTETALFKDAFNQRDRLAGRYMVLWLRHGSDASLRLGVVISRRTERLAVRRNRAKRRLREIFRLNRHKIKTDNVDIVLVARSAVVDAVFQAVEDEFLQLAGKAGLLD